MQRLAFRQVGITYVRTCMGVEGRRAFIQRRHHIISERLVHVYVLCIFCAVCA